MVKFIRIRFSYKLFTMIIIFILCFQNVQCSSDNKNKIDDYENDQQRFLDSLTKFEKPINEENSIVLEVAEGKKEPFGYSKTLDFKEVMELIDECYNNDKEDIEAWEHIFIKPEYDAKNKFHINFYALKELLQIDYVRDQVYYAKRILKLFDSIITKFFPHTYSWVTEYLNVCISFEEDACKDKDVGVIMDAVGSSHKDIIAFIDNFIDKVFAGDSKKTAEIINKWIKVDGTCEIDTNEGIIRAVFQINESWYNPVLITCE